MKLVWTGTSQEKARSQSESGGIFYLRVTRDDDRIVVWDVVEANDSPREFKLKEGQPK